MNGQAQCATPLVFNKLGSPSAEYEQVITTKPDLKVQVIGEEISIFRESDSNGRYLMLQTNLVELATIFEAARKMQKAQAKERIKHLQTVIKDVEKKLNA